MSASNAQLAGLLAGFMIVSLTTLLTIKRDGTPHFQFGVKHATVLLGLGIIILGLDAYLFGSIAATRPPEHNNAWLATDFACHRAWVQFMPAAGLLALGALTLVTGLTWMIVCHGGDIKEVFRLARQSNLALAFVAIGALALLGYDSHVFINEMHDLGIISADWGHIDHIFVWVILIAVVVYLFFKTRSANKFLEKIERQTQASSESSAPQARDAIYDPDGCVAEKVDRAAMGIILYLFVAILFTLLAVFGSGPGRPLWWGPGLYIGGVVLCLVATAVVFGFVVYASPGMNGEHGLSPADDTQSPQAPKGAGWTYGTLVVFALLVGCFVGLHLTT